MKNKKELFYFLFYAFFIPLICVFLVKTIPFCKTGIPNLMLFGIQGASPFLAAIIVTIQHKGLSGLTHFLKAKYLCNFKIKYVIIAAIIPIMILTISKIITLTAGYGASFFTPLSANKMLIITWALIAEELGWRGYLQDKLKNISQEWVTPLVTGAIWTSWHYHFFLLDTMDGSFAIFAFGCIAESYGYYTITKIAKGNVIPASVWHFVGNLFFNLYLFSPQWNQGSTIPFVIANLFYTINIILFIWYKTIWSKKHLSQSLEQKE